MKKILYVSCHSVLQVDEVKLLRGLNHKVDIVEPSDNSLHPDLSQYDVVIVVHRMNWLSVNCDNLRPVCADGHQAIYYRSIGQSHPRLEQKLNQLRREKLLRIIRYSPSEEHLNSYAGQDYLIRFSKDHNVYKGWEGSDNKCATFCNHIWNRPVHCKLKYIEQVTEGLDRILYGWDNEKITTIPTQELKFEDIPAVMRKTSVAFYCGTFPASYTLSFIELLMTGVPVISIGKNLFYEDHPYWGDMFEVPDILAYGAGSWADKPGHIRDAIDNVLENREVAEQYSEEGRRIAIKLFSEPVVKAQWKDLLKHTTWPPWTNK